MTYSVVAPSVVRCCVVFAVALASGCGEDGTIDLLGGGGSGGAGGAPECTLHDECGESGVWCDTVAATCGACPAGLTQCGGTCVDTSRDGEHCGGCFGPCGVGQRCEGGTCVCHEGLVDCGAAGCRDTSSDPEHCSGCDHPCTAGHLCNHGMCTMAGCSDGLTACDLGGGHTGCFDLQHGPRCGSCDVVCGPHEVCVVGGCRELAPATPCTSCPCDHVCHATFGSDASCCSGVHGDPGPTCVDGPCP